MKNILNKIFSSTTFIIIGSLVLVSGFNGNYSAIITGTIIIIGALVYRSAKKRTYSNQTSYLRLSLEIIGLFIIVLIIGLQNNIAKLMVENPITNMIVPLIIFSSYIYLNIKKHR